MISVGWTGGAIAQIATGIAADSWGLSYAITYSGVFYILAAAMMAFAIVVLVDKDAKKIAAQAASL
jgi:hypothetical protein